MQPDPSLGISANFPSATVRNALLFAMQMAKPNAAIQQVRFVKRSDGRRYFLDGTEVFPAPEGTLRLDRDGDPLDPNVEIQESEEELVDVDVAVEKTEATAEELPVGNFRPVKATVTLMEQEYQQIAECTELVHDQDRYRLAYELDVIGLFDLTFHTLIFFAIDES